MPPGGNGTIGGYVVSGAGGVIAGVGLLIGIGGGADGAGSGVGDVVGVGTEIVGFGIGFELAILIS